MKTLTSDNLASAIDFALQEKVKINLKALAKNIATENGALDCARVIVASLTIQYNGKNEELIEKFYHYLYWTGIFAAKFERRAERKVIQVC